MKALKPPVFPDLAVDSPARRRLPILLRRAWYRLNQAFRRRIAVHGITPDQFTVLRSLTEVGQSGLIQSELTRIMSSDPNTIGSLLDRMEKAGWIGREQDQKDRRAFRVRMLARGEKKYGQVRDIAVDLQQTVLKVLPSGRQQEFLEHLALVADACQEAAQKVSTRPRAKS